MGHSRRKPLMTGLSFLNDSIVPRRRQFAPRIYEPSLRPTEGFVSTVASFYLATTGVSD